MNGLGDRPFRGVQKFLPSPGVVSLDLYEHLLKVLSCAAEGLRVNVGIFLDVHGKCVHPDARFYALTAIEPVDDWGAAFNAAIDDAYNRYGVSFRVRIWISQAVLEPHASRLFVTGALAHELAHARQYDAHEDLYLAWVVYDRSLQENHCCLPHWHKPLEIDAELAAREIVRQLHGTENLEELRTYYPHSDYKRVLEMESLGKFDAGTYFRNMVVRSDFASWQRRNPEARRNPWLQKLEGELRSMRQDS